jgi:hypothetical protein
MMDDKESQQGTLLNWSISIKGALLGNYTYLWSTGDTTPYLKVAQPGTYKVKIENQVSVLEKTFLVLPFTVYSQVPLYACPGNSVTYQGVTERGHLAGWTNQLHRWISCHEGGEAEGSRSA